MIEMKCICGTEFVLHKRPLLNRQTKYPQWVHLCKSCFSRKLIESGTRKNWSQYNPKLKGISLDERLGPEKSRLAKVKLASHPGPWLGKHITPKMKKAISRAHKGKSLSDEHRQRLSQCNSGKGNPMFGKPAPKGSGRSSCAGYFGQIHFRSFSELSFLVKFPESRSAEHFKTYYNLESRLRSYHPDFICNGIIYEVKPDRMKKIPVNQLKFEAAEKTWANFKVVSPGIDFPFLTSEQVGTLEQSGRVRFTRRKF